MNVSAQAHVVSEIPSVVVGVFVNHHIVAVPIPAVAVGKVKRGDAEIEAAKPETAGIPTLDAPPMSATEATLKAAILPGMVHVEAVVIRSPIVADPFAVVVHVRGFGMAVAVLIRVPVVVVMVVVVAIACMLVAVMSLRAMVRNVSSTDIVVMVVFLSKGWQRQEQDARKDSGKQLHLGKPPRTYVTICRIALAGSGGPYPGNSALTIAN
jgi:hypothetical protein